MHYLYRPCRYQRAISATRMYTIWTRPSLLIKQLELVLTSGELNPRHQHTVDAVCKRPDLRSRHPRQLWLRLFICLSNIQTKVTLQNNLLFWPGVFTTPLFHFSSLHIRKIFSMKTLPVLPGQAAVHASPVRNLADTAVPTAGPALRPHTEWHTVRGMNV